MNDSISPRLRSLVGQSVAILGHVIRRELGNKTFHLTETIRKRMADLRDESADEAFATLKETFTEFEKLETPELRNLATSFTLMLELMNVCENAYRSYRLRQKQAALQVEGEKPSAIIYVLTAHPTEARAPQNIAVFHEIQSLLIRILSDSPGDEGILFTDVQEKELLHWLEIAWRTPIVRDRAPKVKDEAEHIYSTSIREDVLLRLLELGETSAPFYLRSWVGGDKDGHPGVDDSTLIESLTLSRGRILGLMATQMRRIADTLDMMTSNPARKRLRQTVSTLSREITALKRIQTSDGNRISKLRKALIGFRDAYVKELGAAHPAISVLRQVFHVFPGLCVPLEVRESSDVLHSKPEGRKPLAIDRMLTTVARISKGGEPRWYVRGFIISMTRELADIKAAAAKSKKAFGSLKLPIVPLFEEAKSLAESETIVGEMLADTELRKAAAENWDGLVEVMVGYSDSSKEAGVLASRLAIAKTLPKLERQIMKSKLQPVFFHGSGGSIDRGGGSIEDQTAWWPRSALRRYKVTVQGEMVERSFATPEIARGQVKHIIESAAEGLDKPVSFTARPGLEKFAAEISNAYRAQVTSKAFLEIIEKVTPYSYLTELKIGSRPAKRTTAVSVSGLRAIPWILCWTQTRVLFPTWWGVGSAWEKTSKSDRAEIRKAFADEPVFTSYVRALGFTLNKIELPVWRMYLEQSSLSRERSKDVYREFEDEFTKTLAFFRDVTGHDDLLWFRPWLRESIRLRSPMIHPLNLLQILSQRRHDPHLLRVSVTGISSGMMTTG